ncbi:hypothetical protein [Actinoplanes sp. N902-109]|uniref:hypothetical protein n=1 Tax=Actinoplanes sp. (strain N902-109) TaxID=649831 RepID=UPI0003293683|nr:hypothetical protein [Actinoplanes sp. N902-109]AGL13861.1 hypothetical protein L083_0351 [Actinoplanes sp. N902-109]
MIGDHERRPLDDLGATWMGNGVELARRMNDLADEVEHGYGDQAVANLIREVLSCEYDPTTTRRTPLPESLREPR